MPERQEPRESHAPVAAPKGQQLSEQERQDIDAASRGIDTAVSGLPDDGPPPAPPGATGTLEPSRNTADQRAQRDGLVPSGDEGTPPLDTPAPRSRS